MAQVIPQALLTAVRTKLATTPNRGPGVPLITWGTPSGRDSLAMGWDTAAPASETWETGDIVWNIAPSASLIGWFCTAGGTPGTWIAIDPSGSGGGSPVATVGGASDTLAGADDGYVILYTEAGLVTVTLANLSVGFECLLVALGAAGLTVAHGGMSFANSFTPKLTVAQGEALYVKQTAASTFVVIGGTDT